MSLHVAGIAHQNQVVNLVIGSVPVYVMNTKRPTRFTFGDFANKALTAITGYYPRTQNIEKLPRIGKPCSTATPIGIERPYSQITLSRIPGRFAPTCCRSCHNNVSAGTMILGALFHQRYMFWRSRIRRTTSAGHPSTLLRTIALSYGRVLYLKGFTTKKALLHG